ncbi:MAG: glycosyltransferase family 2 protein [Chloroflexota bacterium]
MSEGSVVNHQAPKPLISVIVPTRNEAENVDPLLRRLAAATKAFRIEVIFVDDSTDHTPNMIRLMAKSSPVVVRVIERPLNRRNGLSGAVVEGMQVAQGKWICVMDADLQHPPEVIPQMLEQARKTGAQLVVGSRKADLIGPLGLSPWRSATSQALTIFARMIFPRQLKNVSDPLTGLFLVQRRAVDVTQLRPDGFKILLELLIRIPDVYVSEVLFDFAQRTEGQSKADFHEGLRFFRHLLRLRFTANSHFVRFLLIGLTGLIGNIAILVGLVEWFGLHYLVAAVVATECATVWNFYWTEKWVFADRGEDIMQRRFGRFFAMNQVFLLFIRLPLLWLLVSQHWAHYVVANLISIGVVSFIRYVLSEQWIWTKGLISRPLTRFYYQIHGLVNISSPVCLPELDYFRVEEPLSRVDLYVRLDRHGTPRCLPGAICYDEGLGRVGFGLSIMQGESYCEVVVSPMLERSPHVLYHNVIEPLLRWTLVRKGYALVHGSCGAFVGQGVLVTAPAGVNTTATVLEAVAGQGGAFMSGDVVILGRNGRLFSYPKQLTISPETVRAVGQTPPQNSPRQQLALWLRQLVHTWNGRQIALWISKLNLPAATLNTYVQRYVPPPRHHANDLVPNLPYIDEAQLTTVIMVDPAQQDGEAVAPGQATQTLLQNGEGVYAFPPHPTLTSRLSHWRGQDLAKTEREIIGAALRTRGVQRVYSENGRWWLHFAGNNRPPTLPNSRAHELAIE